jgi:hypothetical protein
MEWHMGCWLAKVNVFENFHVRFLNKNFTPQGHWFLELNLEWADSTVTLEEMSDFRVVKRKEGKKNYGPIKK